MTPEDATPDESQDTSPAPEAQGDPEGTPAAESAEDSQPAVNWEERYQHLQPEYTRATQKLSQYEQFVGNLTNEETQAEALRALGIELQDDETDEFTDPVEALGSRLDQFENYLASQAQAKEQAEYQELESQYLNESIQTIEGKENAKFSAKERDAILGLADRMRDQDGVPDVEGAYALLSDAAKERQARYIKSKKSDELGLGTAGLEKVDLSDDDVRIAETAKIFEAALAAEE